MVLESTDPDIYGIIQKELNRQRNGLEMIASENFASRAVLEAVGSVLTNKYSEGLPNKRYYGGNQFIDLSESLAIERAKKLFGAEHANVQPHSGSSANITAYFAMLEMGQKILAITFSQGGHLTHGSPVNFSGKLYKIVNYELDPKTEMLDYDHIRKRALEEKPNVILSGYSTYSREVDFKAFGEIAAEVGAYHISDIAQIAGLVAAGVHPSPIPYADVVTTTTHKTLRGPRGAMIMSKAVHGPKIDKAVFPGTQGGPLDHAIAGKAVCFLEASKPEFKEYAKQIVKNSRSLADEFIALGYRIVSGGTDNHLIMVDVAAKGMGGKEAQNVLESCEISVNKNMIPYDKRSPFDPSGIRIGTPALTTRGMKESEMRQIAGLIDKAWTNRSNEDIKKKVKEEVFELCQHFPLYEGL